jgi:prepilin-type N-terminal cleavage/methylation domain-containing protein
MGSPLLARPRGKSRGFTFAEVLMVIGIIGILTSLAYWRMGPGLVQARVNRAAWLLAADLQYAQLMAARQRRPVVVIVVESTRSYAIRDRATAEIFRQRDLGDGTEFQVDSLEATPTTIEIFPTGVTAGNVTFRIGLAGHEREVRLTRAGQVRINSSG